MNEKELNEITSGTLGLIMWRNCFSVKLFDQELIVRIPFKKASIPLTDIYKVKLQGYMRYRFGISYALSGKYLKILHRTPKTPQNICFLTENWNAWVDMFKKRGILVDISEADGPQLNAKLVKGITLFFIIISSILAIAALVVAIIAFIKTRG
ncbi:MAG: hypothetical protein KJ887_01965 [Candidatus Omnitrophica bacterium]|nr:hypothetical protein [Candidatus Omnitrophota bacterium]MBU1047834.1 hypothetical protein [Candidatus Omnitrophota bacterium]MBU1630962.1 hypothetical protein [Candidatus Omnitrophota bacterium]MBU1888456.1 hypothetical protein [Candidatus Omnitrophota bacterium]